MIVNPKNSTIDGWEQTPEEWEQYNIPAATVIMTRDGGGYLRVPHRTDKTFHRLRCNLPRHTPQKIDGVWHWVKA